MTTAAGFLGLISSNVNLIFRIQDVIVIIEYIQRIFTF